MKFKKWAVAFFSVLIGVLILLGSVTAVIDPYFHYHKPLPCLQYRLFFERYQNDGIQKHFDYDALITGNSMAENFKKSDCDEFFGTDSIKTTYSGASAKEITMGVETAIEYNPNLRMVVAALDYDHLIEDKDAMYYDADDYPTFLYNKNPLDDVKYLLNKSILKTAIEDVIYTLAGNKTTTFDEYSCWDDGSGTTVYGLDQIMSQYKRPYSRPANTAMTQQQKDKLEGNVEQNIVAVARDNPQIDFYYFIPPYSMVYWDKVSRQGNIEVQIQAEQQAIELMLACDNIHLFSFMDDFDLVQDFDRYKDYIHYDPAVNTEILRSMAAGEHELTKDNYLDYLSSVREFYSNYDYDALFVGYEVPEGNGE